MAEPKGEYRALFPAGAVARYVDDAFEPVALDDLEMSKGPTGALSTDPDTNILIDARFGRIVAFLERCVADYLDNIVCYQYEDFKIAHAWVNRASEGAFQPMHMHGNSIVSGVYYLRAHRDNSPLIFEKSEINTSPYLAVSPAKQTPFNSNRVAMPVESGICFLFPSNIRHGYDVPNAGGERASLAFNVMLTGIGRFYRV